MFDCLLIDDAHNSGIIGEKYDTVISHKGPPNMNRNNINAVLKVFHISGQILCSQWQPDCAGTNWASRISKKKKSVWGFPDMIKEKSLSETEAKLWCPIWHPLKDEYGDAAFECL